MNKNWNDSIQTIPGTMKTDKDGKIIFTVNQFGKYTATLKVYVDNPWSTLERKPTWVFVDGLREQDVNAFKQLENDGEINNQTELVVTGHLVKTPGKPGMNDMYNLKTLGIRAKQKDEKLVFSLDEALSKDEWQVIRKEKFGGSAAQTAAPSAPVAPSVPF